jgi:hypothetical protein
MVGISVDDTAAASSPHSIAGRLDLPPHTRRRCSIAIGQAPVSSSSSVLPFPSLLQLGCGSVSMVVSLLDISLLRLVLLAVFRNSSQVFFRRNYIPVYFRL